VANTADHSTGGLSTGIGFESTDLGAAGGAGPNTSPYGKAGIDTGNLISFASSGASKGIPTNGPGALNGFTDDYQPGISLPSGVATTTAILTTIGGGKSVATPVKAGDYSNTNSVTTPYVAQPLLDMGVGGSRDAGAGPAFTGFGLKSVTAVADLAQGAVIETGFVNRTAPAASGVQLKSGMSAFGSASAASPAVT